MTVWFHAPTDEKYGALSNFAPWGVDLDGSWWPTVEHFFQAQKFAPHDAHVEAVRPAATPKRAAAIGRERGRKPRADWEEVRDSIMRRGVLRKFELHAVPRDLLLSTGGAEIVENGADRYWGHGGDGSGFNRLGFILMVVRAELRRRLRLN